MQGAARAARRGSSLAGPWTPLGIRGTIGDVRTAPDERSAASRNRLTYEPVAPLSFPVRFATHPTCYNFRVHQALGNLLARLEDFER